MVKFNKQAMLIAVIAEVLDQAYHIATGLTHTIFSLSEIGTMFYILSKFVLVYVVASVVLGFGIKGRYKTIKQSFAISTVSAIGFAGVLAVAFPYQYSYVLHLAHFFAFFVASIVVLEIIKKR